MEITKDIFDKVQEYSSYFIKNRTLELEAKYKDVITKDMFTRGLEYLIKLNYKQLEVPDTLDISTVVNNQNYRVSLKSTELIAEYCRKNMVPDSYHEQVEIISKTFVQGVRSLFVDDYGFKIDIRDEKPVTKREMEAVLVQLPLVDKGYRFKKRYSFEDAERGLRYDFSVVKSSYRNGKNSMIHKNFVESGLVSSNEVYEIEIECLRQGRKDVSKIASDMLKGLIGLYAVLNGDEVMISKKEKADTLKEYLTLCFTNTTQQLPRKKNRSMSLQEDATMNPKSYFFGPQPITLEKKNIIKPDLGVLSIQENYTVTEKADGERHLLFINKTGRCYLINNRLGIKYVGVKINSLSNCIFDGEYVTKDVLGNDVNVFAIFDAYYYNGTDVRSHPLIADGKEKDRHFYMKEFVRKFGDKFEAIDMKVINKDILHGDDIFEQAKEILKKSKNGGYMYHIDGLVFTPKTLGVGCDFEGDAPNNLGTWTKVLKWKPSSENTIDFLVKFERDQYGKPYSILKGNEVHKSLELFVGYNPLRWEPISPLDYFAGNVKRTDAYYARKFIPPDVTDTSFANYHGSLVCINGDIIDDNGIVEFAYKDGSWTPLRVRKDKTDSYKKNGLSNTANDYGTALNVWQSIIDPVTEDHIMGITKITKGDLREYNIYYSRSIRRDKFASRPMMDYHNWIKNKHLINRPELKESVSIMDIACGKGGDLPKWIDGGYKKVFGIDVVKDNIENSVDGAYARTHDYYKRPSDFEYVYLTMDGSKQLTEEYIASMENVNDQTISNIVFGYNDKSAIKEESLRRIHGFGNDRFDVVSCQFALHYFFKDEDSLDNFVHNVDTFLVENGYFIGTCLSSKKIKDLLREHKKGGEVSGKRNGRTLWNIKKLYTKNTSAVLGEEIEIYMESIGARLVEYLVNIDILVKKFKKLNIHLVNLSGFEDVFEDYDLKDKLSDEEKQYSFMNQFFIFQKGSSKEAKKKIKASIKST
jgi:mRNA (guanine-N7-)-methyltransferase